MSDGNWQPPPVFEATLRLNRLVLALKKHEIETKIERLRKLLIAQMARISTEGK